jgi:hypothetical protein
VWRARIEAASAVGDIGHTLQILMSVGVANIIRDLTFTAIIRSSAELDTQGAGSVIAYGVEFILPEKSQCLLLYAYVYAQIGGADIAGG